MEGDCFTFRSFDRDIPVGLSTLDLHQLAEEISFSKKMSFEEVLLSLKNDQTKAASEANQHNLTTHGKGYRFYC